MTSAKLDSLRKELLKLVNEKAVVRERVTLASGKESNYYIDGKQVTLDPRGMHIMAQVILEMIQGLDVDAIGGPTLGADPIASAVSVLSADTKRPIRAFIARKEAKKHGMQRMIEGPKIQHGDRVVMVEDVITTGGSVLKSIQEIEKLGAQIVNIICLVDRNEGAWETLKKYHYTPIFEQKELTL